MGGASSLGVGLLDPNYSSPNEVTEFDFWCKLHEHLYFTNLTLDHPFPANPSMGVQSVAVSPWKEITFKREMP